MDDLGAAMGLGCIAVVLLGMGAVLWLMAVARHRAGPSRPHDGDDWLRRPADWPAAPPDSKDWFGAYGTTDPPRAEIAEIVSRSGVVDTDGGADSARLDLRVRLADDRVVALHVIVESTGEYEPGALLPITFVTGHGDPEPSGQVANRLDEDRTRRLLLDHRRDRGLLDERTHAVLSTGRTSIVAVDELRPTGRARAGHVEVAVRFTSPPGNPREATGYLRPRELAAVRWVGTAPVTTDDEGRWALGPTWY